MENQNLLLKLSRLFPSSFNSCRSRTPPDVADTSIFITKPNKTPRFDHSSSFLQKPPKPVYSTVTVPKLPCRKSFHSSNARGRKCPPVTPASTLINPAKTDCKAVRNHSSSSNSGRWFTSSDDYERPRAATVGFDFYSLSSSSGDSRRPKTNSPRFRRREGMKSIDGREWCTVPSRCSRRTAACGGGGEHRPGSDHAATQLYYHGSCRRRRRTAKSRRRNPSEWVIGEGLAVEKSSSDPYGDFMASMVEMIIETQIFGAEDLDRLLFCFLSLNKEDYHAIIFEVFSEICQTLFCN